MNSAASVPVAACLEASHAQAAEGIRGRQVVRPFEEADPFEEVANAELARLRAEAAALLDVNETKG